MQRRWRSARPVELVCARSGKDRAHVRWREAMQLFEVHRDIMRILRTLDDVGLSYIRLGQSSPTLSGGEAQRIKLSAELAKKATGRTLYILDEPTSGLHFADIAKLLEVLTKLRDAGNTVLVIEHNLDVVKCADWLIDLGPEGGDAGGRIVDEGPPEHVVQVQQSYTGQFLRAVVGEGAEIFFDFFQRRSLGGDGLVDFHARAEVAKPNYQADEGRIKLTTSGAELIIRARP